MLEIILFLLLVNVGLQGLLCFVCFVGLGRLIAEAKVMVNEVRKLGVE